MTCINPKKALLITREMYDNGELIKVQKQMKIIEVKYQETKTEEIRQGKKTLIIKSEPIELPCRKCIGCKLDKANDWATRSIIEAKNWKNNCFVTLTYDEEHIPKHRLLQKSDVQKFWKRLRKQEQGIS